MKRLRHTNRLSVFNDEFLLTLQYLHEVKYYKLKLKTVMRRNYSVEIKFLYILSKLLLYMKREQKNIAYTTLDT